MSEKPFIKKGDRVRYFGREGSKYRREDWPPGAWMEPGIEGVVIQYHAESPEVFVKGERFEAIPPWATVRWAHGGATAIDPDTEGTQWERVKSNSGDNPFRQRIKFQKLPEDTPYEAGQLAGMQMDTIPDALENLRLDFTQRQVSISPWLTRKQAVDLYVADAHGDFLRQLSNEEKVEFEKGIRDWLRGIRGRATRQIWPLKS